MPRHSTVLSSRGAGLRAREAPAVYSQSSSLSGGRYSVSGGYGTAAGARKNQWVAHVLEYQSKNGVSYKEALKGARASYKK